MLRRQKKKSEWNCGGTCVYINSMWLTQAPSQLLVLVQKVVDLKLQLVYFLGHVFYLSITDSDLVFAFFDLGYGGYQPIGALKHNSARSRRDERPC